MTVKKYKRKSDGKVAERYGLYETDCLNPGLPSRFIKDYYVIPGEPANIQQEEVDNTDKWEIVEVEIIKQK